MVSEKKDEKPFPASGVKRRNFLKLTTAIFMFAGLFAGYGAFFGVAGRYLFPAKGNRKGWLFVTEVKKLKPGDSISYKTPEGAPVAIARQENSGGAADFIALSSVCPHLGCQVQWQGNEDRFFCPCHNGVFNPEGKAISGPPAEAGQSLSRYPLKVEKGLLYIEVPLEKLISRKGEVVPTVNSMGPGHDPVLSARQNAGFK